VEQFLGFWIFQISREKTRELILLSDFTRGNNFSQNSCAVFESNKYGSHMVVFVKLFATNFIEVQQSKRGVNVCWIFVVGSLFQDLIIDDHCKIFEIRDN